MDESPKAQRYERLYPETGATESQKEERMERMDFSNEAKTGRRTGRNRGIVIPELPWHREKESAA